MRIPVSAAGSNLWTTRVEGMQAGRKNSRQWREGILRNKIRKNNGLTGRRTAEQTTRVCNKHAKNQTTALVFSPNHPLGTRLSTLTTHLGCPPSIAWKRASLVAEGPWCSSFKKQVKSSGTSSVSWSCHSSSSFSFSRLSNSFTRPEPKTTRLSNLTIDGRSLPTPSNIYLYTATLPRHCTLALLQYISRRARDNNADCRSFWPTTHVVAMCFHLEGTDPLSNGAHWASYNKGLRVYPPTSAHPGPLLVNGKQSRRVSGQS